jgi:hypothetical protein
MTNSSFLSWLGPLAPRLCWSSGGRKATASFFLVWAVQVALAVLLLPALLVVLAISGTGIVILWLAGVLRKAFQL